MEHEETLDVESFLSTPIDEGLPMSPPSPHRLFCEVNRMKDTYLPPSAEAGKKLEQELELPDLTCTPTTTDVELVQDYLCPAIRRTPEERSRSDLGRARVNPDLPRMDPWELPGMIARSNEGKGKGGMMRDKYYLTDHTTVASFSSIRPVHTPNGIWQKHPLGTVITSEHNRIVGVKKTMRFHQYMGAKTNWIMNIYYSFNEGNSFLQAGLVLCHVFETDSPDYDDNPKCLGCHLGACSGHHHDQEFGAPSKDTSFNSTQPEYRPMHYVSKLHSDQRLKYYIAEYENILLGDPDYPDNSVDAENSGATRGEPPTADHGQSKKRKKISDVWDYFTKIFAHDTNGKVVTYAACNHCCKILSASSKNGTSQLARHACPCKFKPVAAGRSAKDSGGDVNVLSS